MTSTTCSHAMISVLHPWAMISVLRPWANIALNDQNRSAPILQFNIYVAPDDKSRLCLWLYILPCPSTSCKVRLLQLTAIPVFALVPSSKTWLLFHDLTPSMRSRNWLPIACWKETWSPMKLASIVSKLINILRRLAHYWEASRSIPPPYGKHTWRKYRLIWSPGRQAYWLISWGCYHVWIS